MMVCSLNRRKSLDDYAKIVVLEEHNFYKSFIITVKITIFV